MIKCKNNCPLDKFSGCCQECPNRADCLEVCEHTPADCGESVFDAESGLTVFQQSQLQTLKSIATVIRYKKLVEDQEKKLKAALYEAMERYGVKKFESDVLSLTLVLPTVSHGIDTDKLKKNYPDVAAVCAKDTDKAGYVKITLKGGGGENDQKRT